MTDEQTTPETAAPAAENPAADRQTATDTAPEAKGPNKKLWVGAAVGIGSAAIVAALLYSNRKK